MTIRKEEITPADVVELTFLESLFHAMPGDVPVMKALADLYTRAGRYEDGLALDRRLCELCREDPLVWYNLGCSWALLSHPKEALDALSHAVTLGYKDHEWMRHDKDLRSLRNDDRFHTLLKQCAL